MYIYLANCSVDKKAKGTKTCAIKRKIEFQDDNECLEKNKTILKSKQRFRSESQNVCMGKVDKNAFGVYYDKRIQTPDGVFSNL